MSEAKLQRVRLLVGELSTDEKLTLIEYLAKHMREGMEKAPALPSDDTQSLYGIWQGKFPDNFDLDEALDDIRHEWENEWPQALKK